MAKKPKIKPLAILSEEDRQEYALRTTVLKMKDRERDACALSLELWQDMMIQKYDLPERFDIDLNTGRVTMRVDVAEEPHAQNGRV